MKKTGTGAARAPPAESSLHGRFRYQPRHAAKKGEASVTTVKRLALAILHAFGEAEAQLGKAVILTDATAGTVEAIWLDEVHGLRVSIRGHPGKRPVSAVKFAQD